MIYSWIFGALFRCGEEKVIMRDEGKKKWKVESGKWKVKSDEYDSELRNFI
jgi:hypothetical protein